MTTTLSTTFQYRILPVLLIVGAMIAGCSSPPKHPSARTTGGGYYMDDGPGSNIPPGIENIPDAVPRIERHNAANFRPYTVLGQRFVPVSASTALRQRGVASWYGRKFHGQKTANGETYDMYTMTAAHPTLPLPSYARVTHERSGRSVIVRVNDRGPFLRGRVIDLSYAAAARLGIIGHGSDVVVVEAITHADIRKGLNMATRSRPTTVAAATPPAPEKSTAIVARAAPSAAPGNAASVSAAPVTEPATVAATPIPAAVPTSTITPDALAALEPQAQEPMQPRVASAHAAPARRAIAPTVTDSPAEGIYLQFGAFSSYISADQLANRLNTEIEQVESRDAHIDTNNGLHRVRIGPYPTRTAAVNASIRIQEATGMQPALAQR